MLDPAGDADAATTTLDDLALDFGFRLRDCCDLRRASLQTSLSSRKSWGTIRFPLRTSGEKATCSYR